ncbi:TPA: hypothetical protein DCL30_02410 [Candidatus Peribacteria bacterium]|nr:hypothetical protein [Candidatus Peribacteria bacterium]HAS33796.1 hypothetical protein [Candidatus Peribacteria bacterium]
MTDPETPVPATPPAPTPPPKDAKPAGEKLPADAAVTDETEDATETESETEKLNGPQSLLEKLMKSTVRQRKRNPAAGTQRYIPIAEIRNDTVLLKNSGLRAVLLVDPLNFNLKSETEQEGIIAGYQNFLNTLSFPIQIIIRSTKVNIDPYISQIKSKAEKHTNPLLKEQAYSYAAFVEKLVDVADIMQKRFYLVVPQDDKPAAQNTLSQFFGWMNADDTALKVTERNKQFLERSILLRDRVNLVQSGLHNVGIVSRRLSTHELIELYYELYNPKTSQEQKLPATLNTENYSL